MGFDVALGHLDAASSDGARVGPRPVAQNVWSAHWGACSSGSFRSSMIFEKSLALSDRDNYADESEPLRPVSHMSRNAGILCQRRGATTEDR